MKFAKLWSGTLSRRTAALLSAALVLLGTIPAAQFAQAADNSIKAAMGKVSMLQWRRVRGKWDLPSDYKWHYAMFGFVDDGKVYGFGEVYIDGKKFYTSPASDVTYFPLSEATKSTSDFDRFITLDPEFTRFDPSQGEILLVGDGSDSRFSNANGVEVEGRFLPALIRYNGTDNNNDHTTAANFGGGYNYRYLIRLPSTRDITQPDNGRRRARYYGVSAGGANWLGDHDDIVFDHDSWDNWNFEWDSDHTMGPHLFYYDEGEGEDIQWNSDGKTIDGDDTNSHQNEFAVWVADEIEYSAITKDYTIRSGQVMNVDDGVILMDNVTLTVEPGAVLSVNGHFYNNGTILNYGTVYIQANSCMMPLYSPDEKYTGQVVCVGGKRTVQTADGGKATGCGDIIIDPNGKLGLTDDGRLYLQQGATLVNNGGVVLLKQQPVISNSCVINRNLGHIHFGQKLEYDLYFPSVRADGGMDELSGLSLSGTTDSGMVFKNSKFVNYGTFYSNQSGFTPLVETRGAGQTFSEGDSFISGANNSYASSDTFTSAEYNEDSQLGGVAGCGS